MSNKLIAIHPYVVDALTKMGRDFARAADSAIHLPGWSPRADRAAGVWDALMALPTLTVTKPHRTTRKPTSYIQADHLAQLVFVAEQAMLMECTGTGDALPERALLVMVHTTLVAK